MIKSCLESFHIKISGQGKNHLKKLMKRKCERPTDTITKLHVCLGNSNNDAWIVRHLENRIKLKEPW